MCPIAVLLMVCDTSSVCLSAVYVSWVSVSSGAFFQTDTSSPLIAVWRWSGSVIRLAECVL